MRDRQTDKRQRMNLCSLPATNACDTFDAQLIIPEDMLAPSYFLNTTKRKKDQQYKY